MASIGAGCYGEDTAVRLPAALHMDSLVERERADGSFQMTGILFNLGLPSDAEIRSSRQAVEFMNYADGNRSHVRSTQIQKIPGLPDRLAPNMEVPFRVATAPIESDEATHYRLFVSVTYRVEGLSILTVTYWTACRPLDAGVGFQGCDGVYSVRSHDAPLPGDPYWLERIAEARAARAERDAAGG